MARGQTEPKPENNTEERLKALEAFCMRLIDSLAQAEKSKLLSKDEIYLLPEGTYFGKKIE